MGRGLQKALGLLQQRLRQREQCTWQGGEREGGRYRLAHGVTEPHGRAGLHVCVCIRNTYRGQFQPRSLDFTL